MFLCTTPLSNLYPINSQVSNYLHVLTSKAENSADPDQLASIKPADQDPHCFQTGCIRDHRGSSRISGEGVQKKGVRFA